MIYLQKWKSFKVLDLQKWKFFQCESSDRPFKQPWHCDHERRLVAF